MEILNRKARYDYEIKDIYEAGIVLKGTEIKSIRNGNANLKDSYAIVKNDEVFLLNMYISPYEQGNINNHEETRTRKLLLNKKEIFKIRDSINIDGFTLIPVKLYFKGNKAKIELGIARGKKSYDKREAIKERDVKRELEKNYKNIR